MSSGKYKMTGCARFFLVLLILIPVAYFSASYLTGKDGVNFIKDLFNSDAEGTEIGVQSPQNSSDAATINKDAYKQELNKYQEKLDALREENLRLKQVIKSLKQDSQSH